MVEKRCSLAIRLRSSPVVRLVLIRGGGETGPETLQKTKSWISHKPSLSLKRKLSSHFPELISTPFSHVQKYRQGGNVMTSANFPYPFPSQHFGKTTIGGGGIAGGKGGNGGNRDKPGGGLFLLGGCLPFPGGRRPTPGGCFLFPFVGGWCPTAGGCLPFLGGCLPTPGGCLPLLGGRGGGGFVTIGGCLPTPGGCFPFLGGCFPTPGGWPPFLRRAGGCLPFPGGCFPTPGGCLPRVCATSEAISTSRRFGNDDDSGSAAKELSLDVADETAEGRGSEEFESAFGEVEFWMRKGCLRRQVSLKLSVLAQELVRVEKEKEKGQAS